MKKLLLMACTLIIAAGISGCAFSMSDVKDIKNIITGETQQTVTTENAATGPAPDADETLKEAADTAVAEEEPEKTEEPAAEEEGEEEEEEEPVVEVPPFSLPEQLAADREQIRAEVRDKFLRYVDVDTTTNPASESLPTTENQLMLAREIAAELHEAGMDDAVVNEFGYVYGTVPATVEGQPVIGLVGHLDTPADLSGGAVRASVVENYDGGDITLNVQNGTVLSAENFPQMADLTGQELVVTDGQTLLGDGKAGVAEIVELCEYLLAHPEIGHGTIRIALVPDAGLEISADYFDMTGFGVNYAYTLDGGVIGGGLQYESFNAADADIQVNGVDAYPGDAKNQMKNAVLIAAEFASMLPPLETPAFTDGYEGYYHVGDLTGTSGQASLKVQVRDFDSDRFEARKVMLQTITDYLNGRYGEGTVQLTLTDKGYNMSAVMAERQDIIDQALEAFGAVGYEGKTTPLRDTTMGAALAARGLPCPTLPTGMANRHTVYECASVDQMTDLVEMLVNLVYVETEAAPAAASEATSSTATETAPAAATEEEPPAAAPAR